MSAGYNLVMRYLPFVLLLAGCGTITHGRYQNIPVTSLPAGAAVSLQCGNAPAINAVTPTTIRVPRKPETCALTLRHEGHDPQVISLERKRSRKFLMNLLWMPGLAVAAYAGGEDDCDEGSFVLCTTRDQDAGAGLVLGFIPAGVGMIVDRVSGGMYERSPKSVEATLTRRN